MPKQAELGARALALKKANDATTGPSFAPSSFVERAVREHERRAITGICREEWWKREKRGEVPKRFRLGPNAVAWKLSELLAWVEERAAERVELAPPDDRRAA
jgi:prophage regulatory protein